MLMPLHCRRRIGEADFTGRGDAYFIGSSVYGDGGICVSFNRQRYAIRNFGDTDIEASSGDSKEAYGAAFACIR